MQANFPDGTSDDLHYLLSEKQNKFITDIALLAVPCLYTQRTFLTDVFNSIG